jgi:hypothetical protein
MPRLPTASDLGGSGIGPARSFVNLPVPDIAGAARSVARGFEQVGVSMENVRKDREDKFRKQERFDTKMGLLRAEEAYADRVRDLDPLDPEYVEKKKAYRRETHGPILAGIKDPEFRMEMELSTEADYVNLGIKADQEHRTARKQKQVLDLGAYTDTVRKRIKDKTYTGDAIADITQMVNDTELDEVTKQEILPELIKGVNSDQFDMDFEAFTKGGISVTPSVRAAVTKAVANAGPDAPSWLGDYLLRTAMVESNGGRTKVNPRNPDVGGTWQIAAKTAPDLGLSLEDRFDDEKSAVGVAGMAMRDYRMLKKTLGREPTPAELYLAHQQGIGGGPKLLANPDKKAADVVGLQHVKQNLPDKMQHLADTITAQQFADHVMGTFNGTSGGGMIDADTTLEALRSTDSYQRMGPDEQAAAEKGVITAIDKQNKEVEKTTQINTARDAANYAAGSFETIAEAYQWIDQNVADPETREKARTMAKSEFEANEKSREADYKTFVSSVTANVMNAVNRRDIDAAFKALAVEGLEPADYEKLLERISKGPVEFDDFKALEQLRHMKYADSEQYKDLNLMDYAPVLKQSTLDGLIKDQESIRKEFEKTGKMPSLEARSKLLDETYDIMGLDVSKNVRPAVRQANTRTRERIASTYEINVQMAVDRAQRELQPEELRRIRDETLIEFTRKETKKGWTTNYDVAIQQGLPDVFTLFDEEEAKLNARIEEENQKRIDAGQPVENLYSPGQLLRRGQEELAAFNAAEMRRVSQEIKAIERGLRSPTTAVRDVALDEEYIYLQRYKRELEEFEINAATLYEWLAVTFAPQDRNAE